MTDTVGDLRPDRPGGRRRLVVALDGPGSSGKSSVGAAAALELGYRFCDTGLLYRAATWLATERGVAATDAAGLVALVPEIELAADDRGRLARVLVDGVDRTTDVHTEAVDGAVSAVSSMRELRAALLDRQRALAADGGIIMAGRDIGTVVLPDADLKIYLDASVEERARRRADERGIDLGGPEVEAIREQLRRRDELDSTRAVAPLRPAADATIIVTDGNRFEDTVRAVVATIRAAEPDARRSTRPSPDPIEGDLTPLIRFLAVAARVATSAVARVRIEGAVDELPTAGPVIFASNHISNADPLIIGGWLTPRLGRRLHWLGKKELFEWPIVGPVAARSGVHPVDRSTADVEAFRLARRILDEGHLLVVFPEGTRSPTGALQTARDGVAMLALRTGAPIVPIGIAGSDSVWPKGRRLPRPGGRIVMRVGKPFRLADDLPAAASGRAAKALATRALMTRIAALLPPRHRGVYADAVGASESPPAP